MTIGQLAKETRLPASTIRYWERIGVLPAPARVHGQRRYSEEAVSRLAVLRFAQACGFRLPEMRHLLHGFRPGVAASKRWQKMARVKQADLEAQVFRLREMQRLVDRIMRCKCEDLMECGRRIAASGILTE